MRKDCPVGHLRISTANGDKIRKIDLNCVESYEDGSLTLYLEGPIGTCFEVRLSKQDLGRVMVGGIDALSGEAARR